MSSQSGSTRILNLYVGVIVAAGALALLVALPAVMWRGDEWFKLAFILVLCVAFARTTVRLALPNQAISLDVAGICLAQLMLGEREPSYGIPAAALCAGVGGLVSTRFSRRGESGGTPPTRKSLQKTLFNISSCILSAVGAGLVFTSASRGLEQLFKRFAPILVEQSLVPAVVLWGATYFVLNSSSVTAAIWLASGRKGKVWETWLRGSFWTASGYLASAALAGVVFALWGRFSLFAILVVPIMNWFLVAFREYTARQELEQRQIVQKEREQKERADIQERHIAELNRMTEEVMASFAMAIEAKDPYTREHIQRVQFFAVALAEAAQVTPDELEAVRLGALVHDVGKIAIPENILSKKGKLDPTEHRWMQDHVKMGVMILHSVQFPYPVLDAVRSHHEHWNGLGYPEGLKGEDIPIVGRIVAVADRFDALTSNRPYRVGYPPAKALSMLRDVAGTELDPRLVELFCGIHPNLEAELERRRISSSANASSAEERNIPDQVFEQIAAASVEEYSAALGLLDVILDEPFEDIPRHLFARIQPLVPWDAAVLYEVMDHDRVLIATTALGEYASEILGMTIRLGEGASGRAAEQRTAFLNVPAFSDIGRVVDPARHLELSASLCVPVVVHNRTLAVLTLYNRAFDIYREHHLRVLGAVARRLGVEFQMHRALTPRRIAAVSDPETGVLGFDAFREYVDGALAESLAMKRVSSLVLLDFNRFVPVNGRYPASLTSEKSIVVARHLRECTRKDDPIGRVRDDVFAVFLEGADHGVTSRLSAKMQRDVASIDLWEGLFPNVVASCALAPTDGRCLDDLIESALNRRRSTTASDATPEVPSEGQNS